MKKFITTFLMMALMAVIIPFAATTANAQTRVRYDKYGRPYVQKSRTFYQRHRDKVNVGIGTGAGLLLGGLINGKKGALIGALAGAGGSALYTYKIKPKKRYYIRNRRN